MYLILRRGAGVSLLVPRVAVTPLLSAPSASYRTQAEGSLSTAKKDGERISQSKDGGSFRRSTANNKSSRKALTQPSFGKAESLLDGPGSKSHSFRRIKVRVDRKAKLKPRTGRREVARVDSIVKTDPFQTEAGHTVENIYRTPPSKRSASVNLYEGQRIEKKLLPIEGNDDGEKYDWNDMLEAGTAGNVWSERSMNSVEQVSEEEESDRGSRPNTQYKSMSQSSHKKPKSDVQIVKDRERQRERRKKKSLERKAGVVKTSTKSEDGSVDAAQKLDDGALQESKVGERLTQSYDSLTSSVYAIQTPQTSSEDQEPQDSKVEERITKSTYSSESLLEAAQESNAYSEEEESKDVEITEMRAQSIEVMKRERPVTTSIPIKGITVQARSSPWKRLTEAMGYGGDVERVIATDEEISKADDEAATRVSGLLSNVDSIHKRPSIKDSAPSVFPPSQDFVMMSDDPDYKPRVGLIKEPKRPYVAILVDADQMLFHPKLLQMGSEGAKLVVDTINKNVNKDLESEDIQLSTNEIRISCYCNFGGLFSYIRSRRIAEIPSFLAFCKTFRSTSPFHLFEDAGSEKDSADERVIAYLESFLRDPHCVRIYLGGLGDRQAYMPELNFLRDQGLLHRISLLNLNAFTKQSKYYEDYLSRKVSWGQQVFLDSIAMKEWLADQPAIISLNKRERRREKKAAETQVPVTHTTSRYN